MVQPHNSRLGYHLSLPNEYGYRGRLVRGSEVSHSILCSNASRASRALSNCSTVYDAPLGLLPYRVLVVRNIVRSLLCELLCDVEVLRQMQRIVLSENNACIHTEHVQRMHGALNERDSNLIGSLVERELSHCIILCLSWFVSLVSKCWLARFSAGTPDLLCVLSA